MTAAAASEGEITLSIVVPAYNEAANVEPVVDEILETIDRNPWVGRFEIVLVDDGSRDETGAIMDRLAREHAELVVVHHQANRGFGAGLKSGFAKSSGRFVTLISADGEIGAGHSLSLLREIGDADLILSRRERTVNAGRTLLTRGVDWTVRLILGFWPAQAQGIYLVRGDLLRAMPLYSDTGLVNLEIILYCRHLRRKITIASVPQITRPRLSGESKVTNLRTIVRLLGEMVTLRLRLRREGREP